MGWGCCRSPDRVAPPGRAGGFGGRGRGWRFKAVKSRNAALKAFSARRIAAGCRMEGNEAAVACAGCGQAAALRFGSFCSSGCYQRDWRRRRRASCCEICAGCRRDFVPTRKDARWCSDSCRFCAYRARLAARAAEEAARAAARQASKDLAASLIG